MAATWLTVLATSITVSTISTVCASQNYRETGYLNNQYSTKTGYFWTYPRQSPVKDSLITTSLEGYACNAVHVNIVSRHGARYTSVNDMHAFTSLKTKLEGTFTNRSFDFINKWVNMYPENQAELVTPLGQEEMFYLGELFGTELHSLLNGAVSANATLNGLRFAATRKLRTQQSADWFFRGLSNVLIGHSSVSNLKPEVRDSILRFYDKCVRYEQETSNLTELYKFENGTEFQAMIKQITSVLGTNSSLSVDDVKMMYRLCATELAVMNNSDWCTMQTDEHREILEYDNDIQDYITRLYGYPVTQNMTCPLFNDVFSAMDDAIKAQADQSSYYKGVFQFGHSDTVVDFAGALGLFKDTNSLRSDNYAAMRNREFRASKVDPFSSHLAFIVYKCVVDSDTDRYAIRLRYNGIKSLNIPACGRDICWYDDVRQYYKHYIDCDWQNVCDPHQPIVG